MNAEELDKLRKRLKPVSVASMEAQDKELDTTLGRKNSNSDQHKIEEGRNLFKFYPPHDTNDPLTGKPNPFAEPKVVVFLPAMVVDRDKDGKEIKDGDKVRMKEGVKPVFNAKVHGKKDRYGNSLTKDLVEEFIRIANERAKLIENKEDREKYLLPIYGQYSPDPKKRVNGITYRSTWETYAEKWTGDSSKFGTLEIGKAIKNRLNKISAIEAANEPLGTDPFTDLENGRAVAIIFNKQAEKPEDYYTTEIDNSTVEEVIEGGRKIKVLKTYPVSDERLIEFSKSKPLAEIYRNAFKRRDLDLQIAGLQMLNDKNKMGICETEEFLLIVEELLAEYPEEAKDVESNDTDDSVMTTSTTTVQPVKATTTTTTTVQEVKTDLPFDDDQDMFSVMNRDELKEFNKDNSCGIVVKPASIYSDNQFREDLRTWFRANQAGVTDSSEEVTTTTTLDSAAQHLGTETDQLDTVETKKPLTAKERLEALRNAKPAGK